MKQSVASCAKLPGVRVVVDHLQSGDFFGGARILLNGDEKNRYPDSFPSLDEARASAVNTTILYAKTRLNKQLEPDDFIWKEELRPRIEVDGNFYLLIEAGESEYIVMNTPELKAQKVDRGFIEVFRGGESLGLYEQV